MSFAALSLPAVALVLMTSLMLLISSNWRWSIAALGLQYAGVFVLAAVTWPADLAVVKLVAGWMAGSVLGMTRISLAEKNDERPAVRSERLFWLLAGLLVIVAAFSLAPKTADWVPGVAYTQVLGGLLLMGMGLLHLGLTAKPLRVVLALLSTLAGFEVLYAAVESSTLVAGLLALVNLGVALVGAYLMTAPAGRETA